MKNYEKIVEFTQENDNTMIPNFNEMMARLTGMEVNPCPYREPHIGDKVILLDNFYERIEDWKESKKLEKLPYCTVSDIDKLPIGEGGHYQWEYTIWVNESKYGVGLYNIDWKYYN